MAFTPDFGTGYEFGSPLSIPSRWEMGAYGSVVTSPKHTGSYAFKIAGNTNNSGTAKYTPSAPMSQCSLGVWNISDASSRPLQLNLIVTVPNSNFGLVYTQSTGLWSLTFNGSTVATGTHTTLPSNWNNLQVKINLEGAGSYVRVRVNGILDIEYAHSVNSTISRIDFVADGSGLSSHCLWVIDDLVIGTGDFPGDIRFEVKVPTADTAVHAWLQNGRSFQSPPAAPTVGVAAGPGLTGDYHYKISLVDADGETMAGTASALVQPADQVVALTNIPTGVAGTTARKIYRTAAGGAIYKLVTTINDNTTTTYNDSLADGS